MKLAAAVLMMLTACRTNPHLVKSAKDGATIGSMKLAWSNAHVVFGSRAKVAAKFGN